MDREAIARLRNCIVSLADHGVLLFDTSILYAYDASLKYTVRRVWNRFVDYWKEGRFLDREKQFYKSSKSKEKRQMDK